MSKFLKLVQESIPQTTTDLDKITAGKRFLQRALYGSGITDELGIKLKVTQNDNNVVFVFRDGSTVVLEVKDFRGPKEEDEGEVVAAAEAGKDLDKNIGGALSSLKKKISLKAGRIVPKLKELETTIDKF